MMPQTLELTASLSGREITTLPLRGLMMLSSSAASFFN
jgi:hypothetical protein